MQLIQLKNDYTTDINLVSIPDFEMVDSLVVTNRIIYTRQGRPLIYVQNANSGSPSAVANKPKAIFQPTDKVLLGDFSRDCVFYSRNERNGINVYRTKLSDHPAGIKTQRLVRNLVNSHISLSINTTRSSFAALAEKGKNFGLYLDGVLIREIPAFTDQLGQVPDVELKGLNDKYILAYTKFDEKNKGTLIVADESGCFEEILKDAPLIGQLRISWRLGKILFFTRENECIAVKIYDMKTKSVLDITESFN